MSGVCQIREFEERIGRSASTVRRWETEGRITARQTPFGQRFCTDADVQAVLTPGFTRNDRKTVVCRRVLSANQHTDLKSQVTAREQVCLARGLTVGEWISEVGGGMNLTCPKRLTLMSRVRAGQVATLVIAYKDRLARFSFEYLAHEAGTAGCGVLVADADDLTGGAP